MLTGYSVYLYIEYQEHGYKVRSSDDRFRDNSPGSQLTADLVLIDNHCFRSPSALRRMAVIKGMSKVPVRIVSIGHCRDSGNITPQLPLRTCGIQAGFCIFSLP